MPANRAGLGPRAALHFGTGVCQRGAMRRLLGLSLFLLGGVAAASPAGAVCVWTGGGGEQVGPFLQRWVADYGGGALANWDVQIDNQVAEVEVQSPAGSARVSLTLGDDCEPPPHAQVIASAPAGGFPGGTALAALEHGFPAERRALATGPRSLQVPFLCIVLLLGLLVAFAPGGRIGLVATCVLLPIAVGIAAWPMLFRTLDTDAQVIRAAAAATNIFGDPFHPFLPFLLNRPATWFSLEPCVLRLVPLAFLAIETVLLALAARRDGGGVAGALAGIWFACEVRRRHGMWDLSDWDIAGTFLLVLLLALQARWMRGWLGALVLIGFLGAGVASSWLMIVPGGVLLGSIGIEVLRRRWTILPALLIAAAFAELAYLALHVFSAGSAVAAEITSSTLWEQMFAELPTARTALMALPLALGIAWLVQHLDRVAPRFVAVCLLMVPAAVVVAHRKSHVAGGYYIGLVTPLLLYAAAVGTVQVAATLIRNWQDGAGRAVAVRAALVLALLFATLRHAPGQTGPVIEYLRPLAQLTRDDDLAVHTNRADLPRLLAYERARTGGDPLTVALALTGPPDILSRLVVVGADACPEPPADGHGFYVALFNLSNAQRRCVENIAARCRDLAPEDGGRDGWVLLRCAETAAGG
jgi:hypothetical protein